MNSVIETTAVHFAQFKPGMTWHGTRDAPDGAVEDVSLKFFLMICAPVGLLLLLFGGYLYADQLGLDGQATRKVRTARSPAKLRIRDIYIHPIKSLPGVKVSVSHATSQGLDHDRSFMLRRVVDKTIMQLGAGFFELGLFRMQLAPEGGLGLSTLTDKMPAKILVTYIQDHAFNRPLEKLGDNSELEIELRPETKGLEEVEVDLYGSTQVAYRMGASFDKWFTMRLGYQAELLFVGTRRKVLGDYSPNLAQQPVPCLDILISSICSLLGRPRFKAVDDGLGFSDVAPFLVASNTSAHEIRKRFHVSERDSFNPSKFRANIVVEGVEEAWEEDYWAELAFGDPRAGVRMSLRANCARCVSLHVDHETGKAAQGEMSTVLKKMQKDRRVDQGMKWSPVFGRYGFLMRQIGIESTTEAVFRVGDVVEVTKLNQKHDRFNWPGISTP